MVALIKNTKGRPKVKRLNSPLSENLIKISPELLEEWTEIEPVFNKEGMYYSNYCWCEFNGKAYRYKYGREDLFSKHFLDPERLITGRLFSLIDQIKKEGYRLTEQMEDDHRNYLRHKEDLGIRVHTYSMMKHKYSRQKVRNRLNALHI